MNDKRPFLAVIVAGAFVVAMLSLGSPASARFPVVSSTPVPTATPTITPTASPTPTPAPTPTPPPNPNAAFLAPAAAATVTGPTTITSSHDASVSWVNFYIDGGYLVSSPPYSITWDSTTVANGLHTLSIRAFSAPGVEVLGQSESVTVSNTPTPTPTASPTPTATPTPQPPTPTPTPTPTPSVPQIFVDSSLAGYNGASAPTPGSACANADAGAGITSGAPWCTLAKVQSAQATFAADTHVNFKRNDVWFESLNLTSMQGTSGHPIVLTSYGSGSLPVIDGGSTRAYCIAHDFDRGGSGTAKYMTIDGIECRYTTQVAISFNGPANSMPGITVQNSSIHDTGPGAYPNALQKPSGAQKTCVAATLGQGAPCDTSGTYPNQLQYLEGGGGTGSGDPIFQNNTVKNCGGHNCLQIHYTGGASKVIGNTVGPGCVHGCLDNKGTTNGLVDMNVVTTGSTAVSSNTTPCLYWENTFNASGAISFTRNVCYGSGMGLQFSAGGACVGHPNCVSTITAYNNTLVAPNTSAYALYSESGGGIAADKHITAKNNIFDGGLVAVAAGESWTGDYNDRGGFQGLVNNNTTAGAHDLINVDPRYVSFGTNDFHLLPGSPLSNAGLPGLTQLNSIGAYP